MSNKRPLDAVHPSRRDQVPSRPHKKQKPDGLGSKSYKKAHPVNAIKSRIRDITRLLSKDDDKLPAHIRIAKERELQSTKHELGQAQTAERRSKMIMRYHQVRFFDRQKATKRLKRAKKRLQEGLQDKDAEAQRVAQEEVEEAEVDLNYAMYYPLDKPYSSLFPKGKEEEPEQGGAGAAQRSKGDEAMRRLVKQCMANDRLQSLRDGKLTIEDTPGSARKKTSQSNEVVDQGEVRKTKKDKRKQKPDKVATQEHADESDGGFFE